MSLINSVNLIIWLKNKILTTNKAEKTTTIQCRGWTLINIIKIYLYNILQHISMIIFAKKLKIKWKRDNYIERKIKKHES
jgi:uncharacterized membrane protein YoaT (DUF817 family)